MMFPKKIIGLLVFLSFNWLNGQDCNLDISTAEDQVICEPSCVDLLGDIGGDYLTFEWTSDQGYSNTDDLNPCAQVDQNTIFTLTANALDPQNLVENGDFELGNVGFTSEYTFNPGTGLGGLGQGSYNLDVVTPFLWTNCNSPTGIMMVVNGATVANVNVYCTEVDISPNTDYVFSANVMNINNPPPILQFSINGELLGAPFVGGSPCSTELFYEIWNSGSATTATICIVNQSTVASGNDFSLDNINFQQLCSQEESFEVTIEAPSLELFADLLLLDCYNNISELYGEGDPIDSYDYEWSTDDGNILGSQNSQSISVDQDGTYELLITNDFGCTDIQSITIEEDFEPIEISFDFPDTLTCINNQVFLNLNAPSAEEIEWIDPFGITILNDGLTYLATEAGTYTVEAFGPNGCLATETVEVIPNLDPPIAIISSSGQLDCNNAVVELFVEPSSIITQYEWSNGSSTYNTTVQSPGIYAVSFTGSNGCVDSASIEVFNEAIEFEFILADSILNCTNTTLDFDPLLSGIFTNVEWEFPNGELSTSEQIIIEQTGTYVFSVMDNNGCVETDSMFIEIDTLRPTFDFTIDSISCLDPGVITLELDGDYEVTWELDGNMIQDDFTIYSNTVQDALLHIEATNGCTFDTLFSFVSKEELPEFEISGSQINCNQLTSNIEATTDQFLSYMWLGPQGFQSDQQQFTTNQSGTYILTVTNDQGCIGMDSILITVDTLSPSANLSITQAGCWNDISSISIDNYNSSWTTNWMFQNQTIGQDVQEITNLEDGLYNLAVTDPSNGCAQILDIAIEEYIPLQVTLTHTDLSCLINTGSLQIEDINGGVPPYEWSIDGGQTFNTFSEIENLVFGTYPFLLVDSEDCSFDTTIQILNFDGFSFSIPEIVSLSTGEQIMFEPIFSNPNVDIAIIEWAPAELFSCTDCLQPIFLGNESSNATVTITDSDGCSAERSILIEVPFEFWLELPNVFSPHKSTGINDRFFPFSSLDGVALVHSFYIYDRWGNLVFSNEGFATNDPEEGWDGKFKSKKMNPGVFTYTLQAGLTNGEIITQSGDVTLVD